MTKRQKTIAIIVGVAVAAYLVYRWYKYKQQGSGVPQLGTNLNSVAPELIGGSHGPQSGLNYYQGSTTIYLSEAVTQQGNHPTGNRTWPLVPRVIHTPPKVTTS